MNDDLQRFYDGRVRVLNETIEALARQVRAMETTIELQERLIKTQRETIRAFESVFQKATDGPETIVGNADGCHAGGAL